jgi:hypothetical protein
VKKTHRSSNPKNNDYESLTKYLKRMKDNHGLEYAPFGSFQKDAETVSTFRVADIGKAMNFVFIFSEYVEKPEISMD